MADVGTSATLTITAAGTAVASPLGEVDLAIDAGGELLEIDGAGDVLVVADAVAWTGKSAAQDV
jgi:hypothetical protein